MTFAQDETGCKLEEVGSDVPADHPVCLFYTGTWHYRNERMADAVASWTELVELPAIPAEFDDLRISTLNNLGHMRFYGLGISEDKSLAMRYWMEAVSLGHDETEFHLCHAYGEPGEPTYDVHRARRHCRKAEAIYASIEDPDNDDLQVLESIRRVRAGIGAE